MRVTLTMMKRSSACAVVEKVGSTQCLVDDVSRDQDYLRESGGP